MYHLISIAGAWRSAVRVLAASLNDIRADGDMERLLPTMARLRPAPGEDLEVWKRQTQLAAIGGYMLILEDGTELSSSSESSGDKALTGMSDLGWDSIEVARLTADQA
jgi:hypothetical protein